MRYLNGRELRDFIKERQAHQVRGLIQHFRVQPRLAIVQTRHDVVTNVYTKLKKSYGEDIQIEVDIHGVQQGEVSGLIQSLNDDGSVQGILLQLPLDNPNQTDELLDNPNQTDELIELIVSDKDVDGLGENAKWDPTTAMAINWLLAGYGVDLGGKKIAIVGQGRLVGRPLAKMWRNSGYDVTALDDSCHDLAGVLIDKDVVVTATGVPRLIQPDMLKRGAVVVDAGVADDNGQTVGDLDDAVYARDDLTITPQKGGVGPLTIAALMDNVIRASYPTRS